LQPLEQHNAGESKFTSTKIPWYFVGIYEFEDKKSALIFEKKIKKWNRDSINNLLKSSQNIIVKFG
jgi:putative endonuclease